MPPESPEDQGSRAVPLDRLTGVRFVRAVRVFATSEVGAQARLLFAGLIGMLLAINGLNVVNSYVGRDFITAIERKSMSGFVWQAFLYVCVFAGSTTVAVLYRFAEERLGLLWREWLTRRLVAIYLEHPTYYRVTDRLLENGEIANPDQRIAEDVRAFTTTTLSFVLLLLNGTFTAIAFSGVMWSISPLLFVVGVGYAAAGSLFTILLGRRLIPLNYAQLDKEANLRSDLIHVRENAESAALLHHDERLGLRLARGITDVTENFRRIITVNRNLGFFTTGYNYLIQIIPALIVAPLFIRGEAEFGVITQSAMAFSQLLGAFSLIITQFQSISSFTAVIARLATLGEALEKAQSVAVLSREECGHARRTLDCPICLEHARVLPALPGLTTREEGGRVAYEKLTLRAPADGRVLVDGLTLSVPAGQCVVVTGSNDAAKLALFRATAGLWDTGEGRIVRPPLDRILFVPERPYLPPGTPREVLVWPGREAATADDEIWAVIEELGAGAALERASGLDTVQDWSRSLALGEQLMLMIARLVLAAPEFAFLDRIDTILDRESTERALRVLRAHSISILRIGNGSDRDGVDGHDAVLDLSADGRWEWSPR